MQHSEGVETRGAERRLLTEDSLLGKRERRYIEVPLQGGEVARLRSLTSAELRRIQRSFSSEDGKPNQSRMDRFNELLIIHTLVGEDNKPLLNEDMLFRFDEVDSKVVREIAVAARHHV